LGCGTGPLPNLLIGEGGARPQFATPAAAGGTILQHAILDLTEAAADDLERMGLAAPRPLS